MRHDLLAKKERQCNKHAKLPDICKLIGTTTHDVGGGGVAMSSRHIAIVYQKETKIQISLCGADPCSRSKCFTKVAELSSGGYSHCHKQDFV
jgi:hypothetical protein